jgi:hypothetical protein
MQKPDLEVISRVPVMSDCELQERLVYAKFYRRQAKQEHEIDWWNRHIEEIENEISKRESA